MEEKSEFECVICKKTIRVPVNAMPSCCGKKMKKMPIDNCTQPAHAEHSRPMENEDACDDGRSG